MINQYIKHLIKLINYERQSQIKLMENEMKNMTVEERKREGRTIDNLFGRFIKKELKLAIAKFSSYEPIETEINVGDMVLISQGDPFLKNISGIVTEKKSHSILVGFSQRIPDWVFGKDLRMDLYVNDITFSRMTNNLRQLSSNGRNALEFIVNHKSTNSESKKGKIVYSDNSLNQYQKNAISRSLISRDFFLIHGPFGTGKTKTLVELTLQEVKNDSKVLVTAESNAAIDNIVERLGISTNLDITRLGHPQKVSEDSIKYTLFNKVENHELYKKVEETRKIVDDLYEEMGNEINPTRKRRHGLSDMEIITNAEKNNETPEIPLKDMKSMAKWLRLFSVLRRKLNIIKKLKIKLLMIFFVNHKLF